ncbi:MAG: PAS domain-containing protein [Spirochaetales bacterium]|nr:PAS domain-containing protein [Spirochaetales bacterium]
MSKFLLPFQKRQKPEIAIERTTLRTETEEIDKIDIEKLKQSKSAEKKMPFFARKKKAKEKENTYSPSGHPVDFFMQENRYAEKILKEIKQTIKKIENSNLPVFWQNAQALTEVIKDIELHFKREEEILFPCLEANNMFGLSAHFINLHKEIKKTIRNMSQAAKNRNISNFKSLFVNLSLLLKDSITKEEQTLFPTALSQLTENEWSQIRAEAKKIGYAWLDASSDALKTHIQKTDIKIDGFRLDAGFLTLDKIEFLLNKIPVEITVINSDDQIVYYNHDNNSRIFPRSIGNIGEKYSHVYDSKDAKKISKIISNFKKQKSASEEFYFQKDEAYIYLRYLPIFGDAGDYQGLVEIVQNIADLKLITGEKTELE